MQPHAGWHLQDHIAVQHAQRAKHRARYPFRKRMPSRAWSSMRPIVPLLKPLENSFNREQAHPGCPQLARSRQWHCTNSHHQQALLGIAYQVDKCHTYNAGPGQRVGSAPQKTSYASSPASSTAATRNERRPSSYTHASACLSTLCCQACAHRADSEGHGQLSNLVCSFPSIFDTGGMRKSSGRPSMFPHIYMQHGIWIYRPNTTWPAPQPK